MGRAPCPANTFEMHKPRPATPTGMHKTHPASPSGAHKTCPATPTGMRANRTVRFMVPQRSGSGCAFFAFSLMPEEERHAALRDRVGKRAGRLYVKAERRPLGAFGSGRLQAGTLRLRLPLAPIAGAGARCYPCPRLLVGSAASRMTLVTTERASR